MKPVLFSTVREWLCAEGLTQPFSGTDLAGCDDFELSGFAPLETAGASDVSFWVGDNFKSDTNVPGFSDSVLGQVQAGLLFVPASLVADPESLTMLKARLPKVRALMPVENPHHAIVEFLKRFACDGADGVKDADGMNGAAHAVPDSARIHPTAVVEGKVGKGCRIGPHCVVMAGAELGANCVLESSVTIYPHVKIGEGCIFQAGAVIGSRGFGFYEYQGKRRMIPHLAGVRIGDRCSFGANTVVAAGFLAPTSIGNDSHFDSMVEIAHNCKVGNHVFMASQSALAGSVTVGDGSEFAGAAKVADHITIGKNVRVAAKAGVTRNVPDGKTVSGFPALEIDLWRRCMVRLKQLGKK
ncbi:MAG: UDP-3-O-(3-hydroxymyristoyl)glucosamine N-acyltransferase [Fibrobacter sp.]|nr:UDP-3-O-(3-hydroxymyristoyl)glucosamine N-acyltransferase [Fibrobacter sp.]